MLALIGPEVYPTYLWLVIVQRLRIGSPVRSHVFGYVFSLALNHVLSHVLAGPNSSKVWCRAG